LRETRARPRRGHAPARVTADTHDWTRRRGRRRPTRPGPRPRSARLRSASLRLVPRPAARGPSFRPVDTEHGFVPAATTTTTATMTTSKSRNCAGCCCCCGGGGGGRSSVRCRCGARDRCSVSELKPTDALSLLQLPQLLLLLLMLMLPRRRRDGVEGSPLAAGPGRAARRQSATARLAPLPGRTAGPAAGAEWAVRRGPVSREIAPPAPASSRSQLPQPHHRRRLQRNAVRVPVIRFSPLSVCRHSREYRGLVRVEAKKSGWFGKGQSEDRWMIWTGEGRKPAR